MQYVKWPLDGSTFSMDHKRWVWRGKTELERWAESTEREIQRGKRCYLRIYLYICVCTLTASLYLTILFSSAASVHLDLKWMHSINIKSFFFQTATLSLLYVFMQHSAVEETVTIWKFSKPFPRSSRPLLLSHYTARFQHRALIYCRDDNKVLCCKGILYQCQHALVNEVMVDLKDLTLKQLLMVRKSDTQYCSTFQRWSTGHYLLQ